MRSRLTKSVKVCRWRLEVTRELALAQCPRAAQLGHRERLGRRCSLMSRPIRADLRQRVVVVEALQRHARQQAVVGALGQLAEELSGTRPKRFTAVQRLMCCRYSWAARRHAEELDAPDARAPAAGSTSRSSPINSDARRSGSSENLQHHVGWATPSGPTSWRSSCAAAAGR